MPAITTDVNVCNLALRHLGIDKEITALTERSKEATACSRFFDVARDELLRDFPWSFCTIIADLTLVEEDPNDEWDFSYQYPSDCLRLNRILSGDRNDTLASRVPYRRVTDGTRILVLTDQSDAQAEYNVRVTNAALFDPDFVMALSLRMAVYMAPSLCAGDPFKLGTRSYQLFGMSNSKAQANSLNEQSPDEPPESEFISSRG